MYRRQRIHRIGRGVPDVAAVADPETGVVIMNVDGKHIESIGGTSAAVPMWAALIARLNQGLNARCGFLNPVLYGKLATGVLRDITIGNNGAFSTGSGWDPCTGLGSPDGQLVLQGLSSAAAAGLRAISAASYVLPAFSHAAPKDFNAHSLLNHASGGRAIEMDCGELRILPNVPRLKAHV